MPRNNNIRFGEMPGLDVGTRVNTKFELYKTGIHEFKNGLRVTVRGIPSLLLRRKDVDDGDQVIIVIETKVELRQKEIKYLSAFKKNFVNDLPIRVVRPYYIYTQYAPLMGYRYDGLYKVTKINSAPKCDQKGVLVLHSYVQLKLLPNQPVFWEREPVLSLPKHKKPSNEKPIKDKNKPPQENPQVIVENAVVYSIE